MSFIYCGLGQIHKGEILKGISFISIYTLLITSLFFFHDPSTWIFFLSLSVLLIMWLMGMVDAYVDDETIVESKRPLALQRVLAILPVIVVSGAIITLLMLWVQNFSAINERLVASASLKSAQGNHAQGTGQSMQGNDPPSSLIFFSVQVAAFKEQEKAESVYSDLTSRGYTVKIDRSLLPEGVWYRLLVGRFSNEEDATAFMEKLYERERFSNMVVRRWTSETGQANNP